MKVLVLCVDRDNDIGTKTGLQAPIIGREENLNAAVMFAIKDPEDSDANALFAAISQYDELKRSGEDAEIATITGSTNIGYHSDRILASQLNQVIEKVEPDEVILVTDGAEDEAIHPIISSRTNIASIRRVIIKQDQNIEGTYYLIKNALREKRFLTPVALILLIFGSFMLISVIAPLIGITITSAQDLQTFGIAVTLVTIALYIISFTYDLPKRISNTIEAIGTSFRQGQVKITCYLVAMITVSVGALVGQRVADTPLLPIEGRILSFMSIFILFVIGGVLIALGGKTLDIYLHTGKKQWSYWVMFISLIAVGFILYGFIETLKIFLVAGVELQYIKFMIYIIAGLLIGIMGGLVNSYVKKYLERASKIKT